MIARPLITGICIARRGVTDMCIYCTYTVHVRKGLLILWLASCVHLIWWLNKQHAPFRCRHLPHWPSIGLLIDPFLWNFGNEKYTSLLEAAVLPSVFTLGKKPFVLGKGFAECNTWQSPLGKIFLGKGSLPSAFYSGTRQNKKNFAKCLGRHSAKYFRPLRRRPLTVILPSARPSTRQFFFKKITLPSASAQALGKVFFFIFF